MAYKLVTCPETAHLELIEHDDHALGMLVIACSRYRPACAVECARTCAARLDQRRVRESIRDSDFDLEAEALDIGDGTNYERPFGGAPLDWLHTQSR